MRAGICQTGGSIWRALRPVLTLSKPCKRRDGQLMGTLRGFPPDCFPASLCACGEGSRGDNPATHNEKHLFTNSPHCDACAVHHQKPVPLSLLCWRDHSGIQRGFRVCALRSPWAFCFRASPCQLVISTLKHHEENDTQAEIRR